MVEKLSELPVGAIIALGVLAWAIGLALVIFLTGFVPGGLGFILGILGGFAVGWFIPKPFIEAYFNKKYGA